MSIEQAEKLKRELTDKYVVVADQVPELRRFVGKTGTVKTVNMSGRALVEFAGGEDIGWYDIAPEFLRVVDAPQPASAKAAGESAAAEKPTTSTSSEKKPAAPAAASGKKLSPLEQARQQDAGANPAAGSAPAVAKQLSPLEQARMQDAGGASKAKAEEASASTASTPSAGKKLSPLEQARLQDSGGGTAKAETASVDEPEPTPDETASPEPEPEPAATEKPATPTTGPGGKKLSPLELARLQDGKN